MVDSEGLEREDCTGMRKMRLACARTGTRSRSASRGTFPRRGRGLPGGATVAGGWVGCFRGRPGFWSRGRGGEGVADVARDPGEISGTDCVCV